MTTRRIRLASILMLGLLLSDSLLAACAGSTSIRRTREDAWLLMIAGEYQLTGELPPVAMADAPKVARVTTTPVHIQQSTDPNEVWRMLEYYSDLRARYEAEAKAKGVSDDVLRTWLAGIDARIADLLERAQALEARRARHRGTAWKRFFDGLGRNVGRAFNLGGKVAKFVIEDVPGTVVELGPELIKELAKQYVEKLKETLRGRLFDILSEKAPGVAMGYLVYKFGRQVVQVAREIDRQLGRRPSEGAEQVSTATEQEEGEGFQLPTSGTMTATCQLPAAALSVQAWCPTVQGTFTANTPLTATIDFGARTFTFGYKIACEGLKKTDSLGTWIQNLSSDEMQGSGTVYEDGWLLGEGAGMNIWVEQGTWWKAGNVVPINKVIEDPSTIPVAILLDTPDDMVAFELGWGAGWAPGGPTGEAFTIERARELGWEGLLGLTPACTTCVSLCEVTSGP
jgi:hypothetical protein